MLKGNTTLSFLINLGLLLFGSVMAFSGLLIQIVYHMGHHGEIKIDHFVLGLNYFTWTDLHKISIVLVSIGMVFHVLLHWKWYKAVVQKKKLVVKNQQVVVLTIIFFSVVITGYISWFIKLSGGSDLSQKYFIEIHDKIALFLFGYLVFHVTQRFKWFYTVFKKVKKYRESPINMERPVQTLDMGRK